ncbi:hypothetical protein [Dactylosporangium aurantiacum]|uniref:hypothetical protein n=1 Tax=Dactylosporangium aurantiacum TaxID=35754 RepID=UPI00247FDE66|nr:hypothetical protein [Dactylosporangium aurantiacum]
MFAGHALPAAAVDDLLLGLVVVRHTRSNSVAYVRDGMALGIGAGQQSRVDCTRLAGGKADTWWLRRHPAVSPAGAAGGVQERVAAQLDRAGRVPGAAGWLGTLDRVAFVSDGALPFADNVEEAARHGVRYIAEPGGSIRSAAVLRECERRGIALVRTGVRLFRH